MTKKNLKIIIGVLFVIAAVLFVIKHYTLDLTILGKPKSTPNGFKVAFDKTDGNVLFFIAFLAAISGAAVALLSYFDILKLKDDVVFIILAVCGLAGIIVYVYGIFDLNAKMEENQVKSLFSLSFAFIAALIINVVNCLGSVYGKLAKK